MKNILAATAIAMFVASPMAFAQSGSGSTSSGSASSGVATGGAAGAGIGKGAGHADLDGLALGLLLRGFSNHLGNSRLAERYEP